MNTFHEMYEVLIRHRTELWEAVITERPEKTLQLLVQEQRTQWGTLLERIEREKG